MDTGEPDVCGAVGKERREGAEERMHKALS